MVAVHYKAEKLPQGVSFVNVVPEVGLEPTRPFYGTRDFKSLASTIPPLGHIAPWRPERESNSRIEVLQTSALPLGYRAMYIYYFITRTIFSQTSALLCLERKKRTRACFSTERRQSKRYSYRFYHLAIGPYIENHRSLAGFFLHVE